MRAFVRALSDETCRAREGGRPRERGARSGREWEEEAEAVACLESRKKSFIRFLHHPRCRRVQRAKSGIGGARAQAQMGNGNDERARSIF